MTRFRGQAARTIGVEQYARAIGELGAHQRHRRPGMKIMDAVSAGLQKLRCNVAQLVVHGVVCLNEGMVDPMTGYRFCSHCHTRHQQKN